MTDPKRYFVNHPADPKLGIGGRTWYGDLKVARQCAGSLPVMVVVPVEALEVLEAVKAWREMYGDTLDPAYFSDEEIRLCAAVDRWAGVPDASVA